MFMPIEKTFLIITIDTLPGFALIKFCFLSTCSFLGHCLWFRNVKEAYPTFNVGVATYTKATLLIICA